jgi:hypothetical protein
MLIIYTNNHDYTHLVTFNDKIYSNICLGLFGFFYFSKIKWIKYNMVNNML